MAPIKSQCSRNYFYGQNPDLEQAIQTVEGAFASSLKELLNYRERISPSTKEILFRFWFLQQTRTEAASQRMVEMSEDTDQLLGHSSESFTVEIKEAVLLALGAFAENLDILDDLKLVLVRNNTSTPFITSDDPAVMVNRWYYRNKTKLGRSFGLPSAGLICVLPISPRVCSLFYDGDVYSIAKSSGWVDISRVRDIDALNVLQYLNCFANLYFHDVRDSEYLESLHQRNANERPQTRHQINYAIEEESSGGTTRFVVVDKENIPDHRRALIHMENIPVEPINWPSFLKWRPRGFVYTNGTGVGHLRRAHANTSDSSEAPFKKLLI